MVNLDLMKLVRKYEKELCKQAGGPSQNQIQAITYEEKSKSTTETLNNPLVVKEPKTESKIKFKESDLKLESLVEVLTTQLQRGRVETKLAVLRWIYHLFNISRPKVRKIYFKCNTFWFNLKKIFSNL